MWQNYTDCKGLSLFKINSRLINLVFKFFCQFLDPLFSSEPDTVEGEILSFFAISVIVGSGFFMYFI